MKKNLIKKVFAVSLSIAMACSFLPAANPVTASAAAPYVSLRTNFKTLKVNQSTTMTLKNNSLNWKITKIGTNDKTIATVYGKTTSDFKIKGKSEGKTTIKAKVKTSKRKKNNTKTLKCRVKVISNSTIPDVPGDQTPVQTEATVETQEQLNDALNDSNIKKITIKPSSKVDFEIGENTYADVDLIVDAPESDIVNSATFRKITINNIRPETWTENGKNNVFSIAAPKARLVVGSNAIVRGISLGKADAEFNLEVNGGTVNTISVTAKTTLNITGTAAENAALINITFSAEAADAVFTTALPVAVTTSAKIAVTFEKGAVGSAITLAVPNITISATNRTGQVIDVTDDKGNKKQVPVNANGTPISSSTTITPGGTTVPGTTTTPSGTVKPATSITVVSSAAISVTGTVNVVSASATTVTEGSIKLNLLGIKTTSPAAVQYSVAVRGGDSYRQVVYWTDAADEDEHGKVTEWSKVDGKEFSIAGLPMNEDITLVINVRVKETDTTAAGTSVTFMCNIGQLSDGKKINESATSEK